MTGKARPPRRARWIERLKASLPTQEVLAAHPWLKPIAHRLRDPALWHAEPESVARGVAIGIFWAFAIPLAQFVAAAAHSVWWRANIPVAAGVTLITNPFTLGFWLWLAYRLGSTLLDAPAYVPLAEGASVLQWLTSMGGPAILGMGIFAVAGSLCGYFAVKLVWRAHRWLTSGRH